MKRIANTERRQARTAAAEQEQFAIVLVITNTLVPEIMNNLWVKVAETNINYVAVMIRNISLTDKSVVIYA